MRKMTDKELGRIFTDGMIDVIRNEDLTNEQIGKFVRGFVAENISRYVATCSDMTIKALIVAFQNQYKGANERRLNAIYADREHNKIRQRIYRSRARKANEGEEEKTSRNMSGNSRQGKGREGKGSNIPPVVPLTGDAHENEPMAISPEELLGEGRRAQREWTGPTMTLEQLKSAAETKFCPPVPAAFVEEFWQRMIESGWRTATNRPIRNPLGELSAWWAREKKNAAAKTGANVEEDTEPEHDCAREVC